MAYTPEEITETFNSICDKIIEGQSVKSILRQDKMPSSKTFFKWLNEDSEKVNQYARACEQRADMIFDEMLDIADDGSNDFMTKLIGDGIEVEVLNQEHIQRSRLRIDARKWMLSKMNPKKYGDKIDVTSGNEPLQPLEFKLIK